MYLLQIAVEERGCGGGFKGTNRHGRRNIRRTFSDIHTRAKMAVNDHFWSWFAFIWRTREYVLVLSVRKIFSATSILRSGSCLWSWKWQQNFREENFTNFSEFLERLNQFIANWKPSTYSNLFQRLALLGELIFNLQLNGSLIHSQNVVVPICTLISNLRFGNIQHQLHCVVVFWLPGLHWQLGSIIRSGYCDINLIKDGCQVFCAVCS